jgi:hypothetical protein
LQGNIEIFQLFRCRFDFTAIDRIHFPAAKSGNTFRGVIGLQLMKFPAYHRIFAPAAERVPSGFADQPRPFVIRAAHLDGSTFEPGDSFHVGLNLFDTSQPALEVLCDAMTSVAKEGIGPGRGRARLESSDSQELELSLNPRSAPVNGVVVRFLTPTELKGGSRILKSPDFDVLFARARDRVSSLRSLYGGGAIHMDFKAMGNRAAAVRMARCELQHVTIERRSTRTGQTHSIGGFTGQAEYKGDLREFVPFLEAAYWTGVGRHTVWGNGWITVARLV